RGRSLGRVGACCASAKGIGDVTATMDGSLIIILGIAALIALVMSVLLVKLLLGGGGHVASDQLRNIVQSQRGGESEGGIGVGPQRKSVLQSAEEAGKKRLVSSRLTLRKMLYYAGWKIPPLVFRMCEILISLIVFTLVSQRFNVVIMAVSLTSGPLFMRWLLNHFVHRRFKAFDADYPQ